MRYRLVMLLDFIWFKLAIESVFSYIFLMEQVKQFYCHIFHFYEKKKRTKKGTFTSMDAEEGILKHFI